MNRKLPVITIFLLLISCSEQKEQSGNKSNKEEADIASLAPEASGAITECSARYKTKNKFAITDSDLESGISPLDALKDWEISSYWGVNEDIVISRNPVQQEKSHSLRVFYPKGSINPGNPDAPKGGAGFYARKGFSFGKKSACLRYKVFFPENFDFARGGKLPGLYGGKDFSGCAKDGGKSGFSTRYMWRENGKGSLYAYIPNKKEPCGQYIGLGKWYFARDKWTIIEQELVLNDIGKNNGIIRVWVNGKNVINQSNQLIRLDKNVAIDGIFFSTFFGGKDPSWASPQDQYSYFSDFEVYF